MSLRSRCACLLLAVAVGGSAVGAADVTVALIDDGPSEQGAAIESIFRREILGLTDGEFDVQFRKFDGAWSTRGIFGAMDRAIADPDVDLVLVTGILANQIIGGRDSFAKPTFLPYVFDAQLLGLPRADRGSGRVNLSYLVDDADFSTDLRMFLDVVEFKRMGFLVDAIVLDAVQKIAVEATRVAAELNVEFVPIPYADHGGELIELIPLDVDAVAVDGLARVDDAAVDRLIRGLRERKLPSFSLTGDALVRRGLLTTAAEDSDWVRLARTIALHMQAVMLGARAEDQSIEFEGKRRLFINLETARAIDVWPRFEILVEAALIGGDLGLDGPRRDLFQTARDALQANLELLVERYGSEAGAEQIREARAALRPQIAVSVQATQLEAGGAVSSGLVAQRSTSGALTLSQSVWSEPRHANLAIQQALQRGREAELEAFRLDTIQSATVAFFEVLRAETEFRVQRDNLELTRSSLGLARDRVRLGSANATDVYRWESELATARQRVIAAHAQRMLARESLNRLLHRPLTEPFNLDPPTLDDPRMLTSNEDLGGLVDNPNQLRRLTDFMVAEGVARAPELVSLRASIEAQQRQLQSSRRAYTSPDVALEGRLSRILEEERKAAPSSSGEDDWSVGVSLSLPLYRGGGRRAAVSSDELLLQQLEAAYEATRERVEQGIRAGIHRTNASYRSISLAAQGAESAKRNLELVVDSYSQGVVSVIELLDAQNAALRASEGADNALYNFLIDLMNVERAAGRFFFMLDPEQLIAEKARLRTYVATEDTHDE